jgi:trehalose-phosphatase
MSVFRALQLLSPPHHLLDNASLFLDFDGTLVEIAARPDAVRVEKRLRDLIDNLRRHLDGRLAIVSGRAVNYPQTYALVGITNCAVLLSRPWRALR